MASYYEQRPTKQVISGLLEWCGGSMTSLPYTVQTPAITETPSPLNPNSTGGFWARFWWDCLRDMRYLNLEFQDELLRDSITAFPEGFPIRLPSTCPAKVAGAVDQVNVGDPVMKVTLPEGFRNPENKAKLERLFAKFLRGLIQQEEKDSDTSPLREQAQNTIGLGMGCRTRALDMTKWPERPIRRRRESQKSFDDRMEKWNQERRRVTPFVVRSLHPTNVCYDRQHTPPEWLFIREPANPWDIRAAYPYWSDPERRLAERPSGGLQLPVVKTTFISKKWIAIYADGSPLLTGKDGADEEGVAPNPYGLVNVWPSAGGNGHPDPLGRPEYELKGIIRDNRDLLLMDASIFNQEEIFRQRASLGPKPIIEGPDEKVRQDLARQVMSSPLKAVSMPPGYRITDWEPSPVPAVIADQRHRVKEDIDRGMVQDVASGSGEPSEPAARTRIRLFQIDKRFATAVLHLQQALEADLTAALYMIKYVLKEPVGVNVAQVGQPGDYVDINPNDIPDGVIVEVNLIGDSEEEKARRLQIGSARLKEGTLDLDSYLTDFAQEPDPERIIKGKYVDKIREGMMVPAVLSFFQGMGPQIAMQAMQEEGIDVEELAGQALAAQAVASGQGGIPPNLPLGSPGGSIMPLPGGGEPLQVSPNGAALPGLPGLVPEESMGNPQFTSPNGPEALAQQLQQGLPRLDQGPRPGRMGPAVVTRG